MPRANDYKSLQPTWERNILEVYQSATPEQIETGAGWYPLACETVRAYAGDVWNAETSAAVCAVLSPRITWGENTKALRLFHMAAAQGLRVPPSNVAGLRSNVERAWYIAQTGDVSPVSGPKVTSFYANLRGDFSRVTLDVWAARAAGIPENLHSHIDRARYVHLSQSYARVAALTGHAPAVLQAIVWVTVRGRHE
jgi:hypothetical protein